MEEIISFFPEEIRKNLKQIDLSTAEEIRIRINQPIIVKKEMEEVIIPILITADTIIKILQKMCENSIYSYQNQICEGFLTLPGGHRVGITGSAVIKEGKVVNINYINSLNFRIARQILNCSNGVLPFLLDSKHNQVWNTLIISPPGIGKTTLLRDIIRKISNGIPEMNFTGITCRRGRRKRRNFSNV